MRPRSGWFAEERRCVDTAKREVVREPSPYLLGLTFQNVSNACTGRVYFVQVARRDDEVLLEHAHLEASLAQRRAAVSPSHAGANDDGVERAGGETGRTLK